MTLLEKCGKKYHQCIIEVSSYYGRTTKGVIVVRRADALNCAALILDCTRQDTYFNPKGYLLQPKRMLTCTPKDTYLNPKSRLLQLPIIIPSFSNDRS